MPGVGNALGVDQEICEEGPGEVVMLRRVGGLSSLGT